MCGPACPVHPNQHLDDTHQPHIHPVCTATKDGFPVHKFPLIRDPTPRSPKAVYVGGKAVRRPKTQQSLASPTTLRSPPLSPVMAPEGRVERGRPMSPEYRFEDEVRMYSSGAIQQIGARQMKGKYKIGRYLPERSGNEYGLDNPHGSPAQKAGPVSSKARSVQFVENGQMKSPVASPLASPVRSPVRSPMASPTRQPVAHAPEPDSNRNFSDGTNGLSVQDSNKFVVSKNVPASTRPPKSPVSNPQQPTSNAGTISSDRSGTYYGRIENSRGRLRVRNASMSTRRRVSCRSGQSHLPGSQYYAEDIELQTLNSVRTAETDRSSRVVSPISQRSDRTVIKRYRSPPPSNSHPTVSSQPLSPIEPDEEFTLLHIKRLQRHRVKLRLATLDARRRKFEFMAPYQNIDEGLISSINQVKRAKFDLDAANKLNPGSEDEDTAWQAFIGLLARVESDVRTEEAMLSVFEQGAVVGSPVVAEAAQFCGRGEVSKRDTVATIESFAIAAEGLTIDAIPAVQTALERSLSCPPQAARRGRASSI